MEKKAGFRESLLGAAREDKIFSIVFYGASTTSAENVMPNWGEIVRYWLKDYAGERLGDYRKGYWNIQTANRGLNGASSEELLDKFEELVLSLDPQLIFLSIGKNDAYYHIDRAITEKNTREIIKKALDRNRRVVFATTVPARTEELNEKVRPYVEVDRKIAGEFAENENFIFVDFYRSFGEAELERAYTLISEQGNEDVGIAPGALDPVHYNKFGNAWAAKILLQEAFGLEFDAEKFVADLADDTKKYPGQ